MGDGKRKREQASTGNECWGVKGAILNRVVSMSLVEKKIFEQRPEGSEGLVSVSP